MNTSTLPTVRARLVDLLRAHTTLAADPAASPPRPAVQVEGHPPGEAMQPASVFCGSARGSHGLAAISSNRKRRQETYGLEVWIDVLLPGVDDVAAAEDRCWTLFAALEDVLAEDPTLGLDDGGVKVVLSAQIGAWEEGVARAEGAACQLRVTVDIVARLT